MAGGRDAQEDKARRYLTAAFEVTGSSDTPYNVAYRFGQWVCDCPARKSPCAHVLACSLVCRLRADAETPSLAPRADPVLEEMLAASIAGTPQAEAARTDPEVGTQIDALLRQYDAPPPTEAEVAERARLSRELDDAFGL